MTGVRRTGPPFAPRATRGAVLGMGIDIVENQRVRQAITTWGDRFLSRVFRDEERRYCDSQAAPWRHYAGRFAVKEATAKAFGTGIGTRVGWLDIQVVRNERTGAPGVRLHGEAAALAREMGVGRALVSISHSRALAIASVALVAGVARRGRPADGVSPASRLNRRSS